MRKTIKVLAWLTGVLIVLPALVIILLVVFANVDWGRSVIERTAAQLSGGQLLLSGVSGHFPDDMRVARIEVHDAGSPWLAADDITLRWSPSRLSHKALQVELLRVGHMELLRLPTAASSREESSTPFKLPLRVDVDRVEVNRIDVGAPIAGASASVAIEGKIHAASVEDAEASLSVNRLDSPGTYKFSGRIDPKYIRAELNIAEPAQGLLAGLARLPDLGPLSAQANIDGPRNAEVMRFALSAGPLRASGQGTVDLVRRAMDLDVMADAPAMAPREDVSWKSVSLEAHVHGPFTGPDAAGKVRIDALAAGGAELRAFSADVQGNLGSVGLHAVLERLRLPGPKPDLFVSTPVDLRADVRLDDPARPVTFAVSHPLLSVQGRANTDAERSAAVTIIAPALAPFAAIAGVDLKGRTRLDANITTHGQATKVEVSGDIGITGGMAPVPALIGDAAKLMASATFQGDEINLERSQLDARTLSVSASGSSKQGSLELNWKIALSDLAAIASSVSGRIEAQGRLAGARDDLDFVADATGDVGTEGFPRGPIKLSARLKGLPGSPAGQLDVKGSVGGAPLELAVALRQQSDSVLDTTIERADWKSAHAEGNVRLRKGDRLPQGRLAFRIARLDDFGPWVGQPLQGSATGNLDLVQTGARAQAKIQLDAVNPGVPGTQVDHLALTGSVDDLTTRPKTALRLSADGIAAQGMTGSARLDVNGTQDALGLKLSADLHNLADADAKLTTSATLNVPSKQASFSALQVQYKGQTAQLLAPARVSFGNGVAVDRLRVGMQQAVLEIAGRVSPALDLTASLHNVTPALIKTFVPDLQAEGTMAVDAKLTGSTARPRGTVRLTANALRVRTGPGKTLPAANLVASADLQGESARVDVRLSGGSQMALNASGQIPLSTTGPIDLHANGTVDAAIANPILEVNGRRVKGQLTLDAALAGSAAKPRINGTVKLAQGEIQDYAVGAHLTEVEGLIQAEGDVVRIVNLSAHAGPGTVSASGTMGVLSPGRPVDVKLTARDARPLATDLLSANMDADLTLRGESQTRLEAAGKILISRAEINIPNALPPTVAVLDVRRPGQSAPPPPAPTTVVGLDLTVDAPRAVFVRGRGLDAEVGGELHIGGTTAEPQITGGFDMRRGTFDLAGASLKFTSGKVSFTGTGLKHKIDPSLDFEAESTSSGITAKLNVTGYADAPKFALTSTPDLPQDEILARLLFGTSVKQLTALQIAQIGAAVASLSGVGGGGVNPLMAVQKSLGLDRLSVGGTTTGGASVEAGRYVSSRVYVGAKQTTSGSSQAQVQVDLTKHLKVQATLGTGGTTAQGATPENDPGSSIGLSYQFEY